MLALLNCIATVSALQKPLLASLVWVLHTSCLPPLWTTCLFFIQVFIIHSTLPPPPLSPTASYLYSLICALSVHHICFTPRCSYCCLIACGLPPNQVTPYTTKLTTLKLAHICLTWMELSSLMGAELEVLTFSGVSGQPPNPQNDTAKVTLPVLHTLKFAQPWMEFMCTFLLNVETLNLWTLEINFGHESCHQKHNPPSMGSVINHDSVSLACLKLLGNWVTYILQSFDLLVTDAIVRLARHRASGRSLSKATMVT